MNTLLLLRSYHRLECSIEKSGLITLRPRFHLLSLKKNKRLFIYIACTTNPHDALLRNRRKKGYENYIE